MRNQLIPDRISAVKPTSNDPISDDILYGAESIRAFLGLRNVRQVYTMSERKVDRPPFFRTPCGGLTAFKSSLIKYLRDLEKRAA